MEPIRTRRRPMAEINVVPYIDVMLVLLVIFMITAPMLNMGVEIELPKGDSPPLEQNDEPMVVTVLENGDMYLNAGGDLDGTTSGLIDAESLQKLVTAVVKRNPEVTVMVGGDERATYGEVYAAINLLNAAGVVKVGLMSDPAELGYGEESGAE